VLYRFNTGGSIGGGVISYALEGNMSRPRRGPSRPSLADRACQQSSSSPYRESPQANK